MNHLRVFILFLCAEKFRIHSEVVSNFDACKNFFYKDISPYIPRLREVAIDLKHICQKLENNYHFATLYSKYWRIPMYSAYQLQEPEVSSIFFEKVIECKEEQKSRGTWFIEPQLTYDRPSEMETAGRRTETLKQDQAVEIDYVNTGFDRGHLNPASYNCDKAREATFTLTNAIPQNPCFNEQTWKKLEQTARTVMRKLCNFSGAKRYFVTGSVPQNRMIPNKEHDVESDRVREFNRVSVPSHLWTAACCDSNLFGFSFAYYGENKAYSRPTCVAVSDLETWLALMYKSPMNTVKIFVDGCHEKSQFFDQAKEMLQRVITVEESNAGGGANTMKPGTIKPKKRTLYSIETGHLPEE